MKFIKNREQLKESVSELDYTEIYNTLELAVNSDGIIPMSDFQDILNSYDIEEDKLAEMAAKVQSDVQTEREEEKNDDLEYVAKEAFFACVFKKNISIECFTEELKNTTENYYDIDIEDFNIEDMFVKLNNEQTIKEVESEIDDDVDSIKKAIELVRKEYPKFNDISYDTKKILRFIYNPKVEDFLLKHNIVIPMYKPIVEYIIEDIIKN